MPTRRESRVLRARSRRASATKVLVNPCHELPCPMTDVVEHDRHDRPADVLYRGLTAAIPSYGVWFAVPIHTVVFDREAMVGPGEVNSTQIAIAVDDFVLKFRDGQATVDHGEPRLALHRRLCSRIRVQQQLSHGDDAATTRLPGRSAPKLSSAAGLAAQRRVECCQGSGPTEAAGDFDSSPHGRRRRPLTDHDQGGAIATVHHQAVDWP